MNTICKTFTVNDTKVLFRKSFEQHKDRQVALIVASIYLLENIILNTSPEVEMYNPFCCLQHRDESFNKINQDFAEKMYLKLKEHSKNSIAFSINSNHHTHH